MTKFSKWILYISSYIPLYAIFIVSNISNLYDCYKKEKGFSLNLLLKEKNINFILIIIFIMLIFVSFALLRISLREASKSTNYEEFFNIKKSNEKVSDYILVYILPFIGVNSTDRTEFIIFILVFLLIGNILVKNDSVYINPMLYMMKYNILESEDKILISKYSIAELKRKGAWDNSSNKLKIRVSKLCNNIYIIYKI